MMHEKFLTEEHDIHPSDLGFSSTDGSNLDMSMFSFSSRDISALFEFLRVLALPVFSESIRIQVTGGGAVKFQKEIRDILPSATIGRVDEMAAVAYGFSFLVRREGSAYIFNCSDFSRSAVPVDEVNSPFPLLLVNVGSGVSMIKIDGPNSYTRVQGSPIGGGTVLGLGRALFNAESFEEIMELSKAGDSTRVDLSVGELIGAPPDDEFWNVNTIASSLTKLNSLDKASVSRADLAQSVVRMVSYNIGYIAFLVSTLHECTRIYFSGKYVNKHVPTMEAISYAVKFYENWKPPPAAEGSIDQSLDTNENVIPSRKCDVRFLHHEGYVGAIGALLVDTDS